MLPGPAGEGRLGECCPGCHSITELSETCCAPRLLLLLLDGLHGTAALLGKTWKELNAGCIKNLIVFMHSRKLIKLFVKNPELDRFRFQALIFIGF